MLNDWQFGHNLMQAKWYAITRLHHFFMKFSLWEKYFVKFAVNIFIVNDVLEGFEPFAASESYSFFTG